MSEFHKRVLLNLFVTPMSLLLGTGGISLLLMSQMLGSVFSGFGFLGFCGLAACVGVIVSNFFCNLGSISKKAFEDIQLREKKKLDDDLDELDTRLSSDRDPRDQTYLREMRETYDSFRGDLQSGQITAPEKLLKQIDELFKSIVAQLDKQFHIWKSSKKVTGENKKKLLQEREEILAEIGESVASMTKTVEEIRTMHVSSNKGKLREMKRRLDSQLNVTKEIHKHLSQVEDMDSRYSEYEK